MARSVEDSPGYFLRDSLRILAIMERGENSMTATQLCEAVKVSRPTFKRYLARIEADLGVIVFYDAHARRYRVSSWGLLSRDRVLMKFHGDFAGEKPHES